jgi:hypothetical protein
MGIDGKPKPRSGIGEALMNEGMLGKSRPSSIRSNRSQYQISEPLSSPYRTPPPPHRRYRTISTVRARYLGEHYPSPIITSTTPHFTSSPCMRPYDLRSSTPDIVPDRPNVLSLASIPLPRAPAPREGGPGRPALITCMHAHHSMPYHMNLYTQSMRPLTSPLRICDAQTERKKERKYLPCLPRFGSLAFSESVQPRALKTNLQNFSFTV